MKAKWFSPAQRLFLMALLLAVVACDGKKEGEKTTENKDTASVASRVDAPAPESDTKTIYGVSDEFGMSTFTLVDDAGRTYELSRTAEDGTYGCFYGDVVEGARYALTLSPDSTAVGVAYNLTQLEKFTKDYYIVDGQLVLTSGDSPEVVQVETLNAHSFQAKGKGGKLYQMGESSIRKTDK